MRPDLFAVEDWERFLKELSAIRTDSLEGADLRNRLTRAWIPLLQEHLQDDRKEIYEDVMTVLIREGIAPPDWSALSHAAPNLDASDGEP